MWNSIRTVFAIFDEALRFAASVDSDARNVTWSAGPSNVTVCIRPYGRGDVPDAGFEETAA
jgi:hypothetical protein